jgi:hypothetical protein
VLAVLQYRWIGEISRGEQDRLRAGLQSALARLSEGFNSVIERPALPCSPRILKLKSWAESRHTPRDS